MKNKIFFFILLFIFFLVNKNATSEVVNKINITGNNRIQISTILEYGGIKDKENYSSVDLNDIYKKIYATGFFEKVSVSLKNNILSIDLVENPLISFFNIQGINDSDELNKLYDRLNLKINKIFSDFSLKKDMEFIKDYYISKGFANVEVIPRVSKTENNTANIVITIKKNKKLKITRIFFIGDKKFSSSDLSKVITSSENGWWKFLSSSTVFNSERVNYDKSLLKNFYLDSGYFDAQISSVDVNIIKPDEVYLTFSINSGNLYNFGKFSISEGENLLNSKTKDFINESKNKYFKNTYSSKQINLFLDKLYKFLNNENIEFLQANINEIKKHNQIDLNLKIIESDKIYINLIKVSGNNLTEEEVIRRSIKFSEGDSFINYKKSESLDRLKNLNIFKDVKIETENVSNNKINVLIKVEEKPTGSISAGAGYGGNGGMLNFALQEDNFYGKGIFFNGGINIGSQITTGQIQANIPDFYDSGHTLYSRLYTTKIKLSNTLYDSKKTGISLNTGYEIFDDVNFRPGFELSYDNISIFEGASSYLKSQEGQFVTLALNYNLERDLRDKKVGTKSGSVFGINQELSSFVSDIPHLKNRLYGSSYASFFDNKQTFNLKYGYSNIFSLDKNKDIAISDRLFVPYTYSKGFEPRGFGPRDPISGDFVGGNNLLYSVLNTTIPTDLNEKLNINPIAFINAAKVWGVDNSSIQDSSKIRSAYGLGLEWKSPLGPININIAKPISKEDTDKTKTFSFEIGTIF